MFVDLETPDIHRINPLLDARMGLSRYPSFFAIFMRPVSAGAPRAGNH